MQGKRFVIALFALLTIATVYLLSLVPRRGASEAAEVAPVRGVLAVRLSDGSPAQGAILVVLATDSQASAATIECDGDGCAAIAMIPGEYRAYRKDAGGAPPPPASTFVSLTWPPPSGTLELRLR